MDVEKAMNGAPQDIEGCYKGGKFYVVQTRPQVGASILTCMFPYMHVLCLCGFMYTLCLNVRAYGPELQGWQVVRGADKTAGV